MAIPITSIHKQELSPEEIQQQKFVALQSLIAEQDQALHKILEITGGLDDAGIFDALQAMVKAKDNLAKMVVEQASREPVTHLINHVLKASSVLSSIDPIVTEKLATSIKSGLDEAELYKANHEKVSIVQLISALNDPDINRATKFGLDFLRGMGKELGKD